ncbi:hypothetical protein CWI38_0033p0010 [Hamiltosporidium tvaerminnensis]|uniref:Uncharacterized protein n=1 Tax=Hamiltosporidium tvaerminnensis TaxID=1176355 RepID=A0A4V2JYD7_9MICR|nr:hypothetical protein CWI38_0033p0010 [Hamiltosporidium tvaerminnensis]
MLEEMTDEVKKFLNNTVLEKPNIVSHKGLVCFSYLGIIYDSRGITTCKSFEEVQGEMILNFISAINQHAISLINYHIGIIRLEFADFSRLDDKLQTAGSLYLSRAELGRGLYNVELRNGDMLLQLLNSWGKCEENLLATLFNEIEKIKLQSNLYNARENELVSVSESLRWLKELKCDHVMKQYSAISRIEMYSGAQNPRYEKMLGQDYIREKINLSGNWIKIDVEIWCKDSIYLFLMEQTQYSLIEDDLGGIGTKYYNSLLRRPQIVHNDGTVETLSSYRRRRLDLQSSLIGNIKKAEMQNNQYTFLSK